MKLEVGIIHGEQKWIFELSSLLSEYLEFGNKIDIQFVKRDGQITEFEARVGAEKQKPLSLAKLVAALSQFSDFDASDCRYFIEGMLKNARIEYVKDSFGE